MWHVAEEGGRLLGYAYAGPWRPRAAYRYAVETSVYLAEDALGRGLESTDMAVVRKIVRDAAPDNYRFTSLIMGIVASKPFQMRTKTGPEGVTARTAGLEE